jgi:hypothetical protein
MDVETIGEDRNTEDHQSSISKNSKSIWVQVGGRDEGLGTHRVEGSTHG